MQECSKSEKSQQTQLKQQAEWPKPRTEDLIQLAGKLKVEPFEKKFSGRKQIEHESEEGEENDKSTTNQSLIVQKRIKRPDLGFFQVDRSRTILPVMMVPIIDFVIPENLNAQIGEKDIYIVITLPSYKKMKAKTLLLRRLQFMRWKKSILKNFKT